MQNTILSAPTITKLLAMAFIVLFATACDDDDDDDGPPPVSEPALIDFGAYYFVDEAAIFFNGVELPVLVGDSLVVGISYSGCSANHEFELRSRVLSAQRAEVWLYKITPDEACQAVFYDTHAFRIPFEVLAREEIVLVSPQFINFPLR